MRRFLIAAIDELIFRPMVWALHFSPFSERPKY